VFSHIQLTQRLLGVARASSPWGHGQDGRATKESQLAKHVRKQGVLRISDLRYRYFSQASILLDDASKSQILYKTYHLPAC